MVALGPVDVVHGSRTFPSASTTEYRLVRGKRPICTTDLSATDKTEAVRDTLSKNQDADKAFRDVGLTPGGLMGDKLAAN